MSDSAFQAEVDAANAYEELFVPALFREWAPRIVSAAGIKRGDRVLDVACGTGVLAREAASRVGTTGFTAGVDPNPGMLTVASRLAPNVAWRQGTAEALPYLDELFDAVVSQFGLMFFTDRSKAVREMVRVLASGGRLAIAVWDSLENTPAYAAEVALIERIAGRKAADALRAPFVLGDRRELAALLTDAGAASVAVTIHHGIARFPSIRSMVDADLRIWLPLMGIELTDDQIQRIQEEAEHTHSAYVTEDGSLRFDSPALIAVGTKL